MLNFSELTRRANAAIDLANGEKTRANTLISEASALTSNTQEAYSAASTLKLRYTGLSLNTIEGLVISDTEPEPAEEPQVWFKTEYNSSTYAPLTWSGLAYRSKSGSQGPVRAFLSSQNASTQGYGFVNPKIPTNQIRQVTVATVIPAAAKWLPITYPTKAMTKNDMSTDPDFPAVANQSSAYGTAYAWMAFNNVTTSAWVSANAVASKPTEAAPQWISLKMPKPLRNITLHMWARGSTPSNPKTGFIQLSNDGETWVDSVPFSNSLTGASVEITDATNGLQCGNSTAYQYVKINVTSVVGAYNFTALSKVTISGEYKEATT